MAYLQQQMETGLEEMLGQFRVNELVVLLTAFKVNKIGKKHELMERARQLLFPRHQSTPNIAVCNKIRDIHSKRFLPPQAPPPPAHRLPSNNYPYQPPQQQQQYPNRYAPVPVVVVNRAETLRYTELPFYDVMHIIAKPQELPVGNTGKSTQEHLTVFSVPDKFLASLAYRAESTALPRIEIQFRSFLLDVSVEQKDDFPPNCILRIDDQPVQLPNVIPTNKPNTEAKRPSRSVNITPYCQPPRCSPKQHRLQVSWTADKRNWAIALFVVRRLTADILLRRLQNNGSVIRPAEHTERTIIRRLGGGDDGDDIAMDSLRVSLLCPLGKTRMAIPIKPTQCEHLQCFDATLFLMMNEKKPTWKCPVCDNSARYSDLIIDGYFKNVLKTMSSAVTEVELLVDGSFKAVESEATVSDNDDDCHSPINPQLVAPVKTTSWAPVSSAGALVTPTPSATKGNVSHEEDVIVLDDSDDEEPAGTALSAGGVTARCPPAPSIAAVRLRPSPCSPTQSEGGGSSASDPSVICLDLADSSSSPPSRPGTDEAHRNCSTNAALPFVQCSSGYSPATPHYEPMTPPVVSVHNGSTVRRPPLKRPAADPAEEAMTASLQLPTIPGHAQTGYASSSQGSSTGMTPAVASTSYLPPAMYARMTDTNAWMNAGYSTLNGYHPSVGGGGGGYYGQGRGYDGSGANPFASPTFALQQSALPDFASNHVTHELQTFLNSWSVQQQQHPQPGSGQHYGSR